MDPATATAMVALLSQGGPWAVVVVVLGAVIRVWRSGEFLSKPIHDTIVAATTQRYLDMLERYKASQDGLLAWRENAERATKAAEEAQSQHAVLLSRVERLQHDLDELRSDLRDMGVLVKPERGPPVRRPPSGREGT